MDWRVGKDRKRKAFAHYKLAKSEAEVIANELSRGEAQYDKLTNEDRMIYSRAYKSIKGISKPLDLIANEYSEAINQLQGIPIQQAVEYYLKHHPRELPRRTVQEVLTEMLEAKTKQGLSERCVWRIPIFSDLNSY